MLKPVAHATCCSREPVRKMSVGPGPIERAFMLARLVKEDRLYAACKERLQSRIESRPRGRSKRELDLLRETRQCVRRKHERRKKTLIKQAAAIVGDHDPGMLRQILLPALRPRIGKRKWGAEPRLCKRPARAFIEGIKNIELCDVRRAASLLSVQFRSLKKQVQGGPGYKARLNALAENILKDIASTPDGLFTRYDR